MFFIVLLLYTRFLGWSFRCVDDGKWPACLLIDVIAWSEVVDYVHRPVGFDALRKLLDESIVADADFITILRECSVS